MPQYIEMTDADIFVCQLWVVSKALLIQWMEDQHVYGAMGAGLLITVGVISAASFGSLATK
jgi:hypothetical protein